MLLFHHVANVLAGGKGQMVFAWKIKAGVERWKSGKAEMVPAPGDWD